MSAKVWAIITNPLNIWQRLRKLRRELRETQRRLTVLEKVIEEICGQVDKNTRKLSVWTGD